MTPALFPVRSRMPKPAKPTGPVGGLDDPRFRYVPSVATNVRKTFQRVRAQLARGGRL